MRNHRTWEVFLLLETNKLVAMIGLAKSLGLLSDTLHFPGWGVTPYSTTQLCGEWFNYSSSKSMLSIYDIHREYNLCV